MKVLFLLNFGFLFGMASSYRARLYTQALQESGVDVEVLSLNYSDVPSVYEKPYFIGEFKGIKFRYATGTSVRPNSFVARRFSELRSKISSLYTFLTIKKTHQFDSIFYYGNIKNKNYEFNFYNHAIDVLKIPHSIEICERPWVIESTKKSSFSNPSPLNHVQGCLVISSFLENWAAQEANRLKKSITVERIPILVDMAEFVYPRSPSITPTVLFAAAPSYTDSLKFVLDTMKLVWKKSPNCRLILTGCHSDTPAGTWVRKEAGESGYVNNIDFKGYVTREELIKLYSQSWALLSPLFDDVISKARFPTKIGEYLASGVPLITNNIGEIPLFIQDRHNAFVSEANNIEAYSEKILEALSKSSDVTKVGLAGKKLAEQYFYYKNYSKKLKSFFCEVSNH